MQENIIPELIELISVRKKEKRIYKKVSSSAFFKFIGELWMLHNDSIHKDSVGDKNFIYDRVWYQFSIKIAYTKNNNFSHHDKYIILDGTGYKTASFYILKNLIKKDD